MKIEEILNVKNCIYTSCPIANSELGHVYLNQTGIWNITFNATHHDMLGKDYATIAQLTEIFKNDARCWKTQQETFQQQLPLIIKKLESLDSNEQISFR